MHTRQISMDTHKEGLCSFSLCTLPPYPLPHPQVEAALNLQSATDVAMMSPIRYLMLSVSVPTLPAVPCCVEYPQLCHQCVIMKMTVLNAQVHTKVFYWIICSGRSQPPYIQEPRPLQGHCMCEYVCTLFVPGVHGSRDRK